MHGHMNVKLLFELMQDHNLQAFGLKVMNSEYTVPWM